MACGKGRRWLLDIAFDKNASRSCLPVMHVYLLCSIHQLNRQE